MSEINEWFAKLIFETPITDLEVRIEWKKFWKRFENMEIAKEMFAILVEDADYNEQPLKFSIEDHFKKFHPYNLKDSPFKIEGAVNGALSEEQTFFGDIVITEYDYKNPGWHHRNAMSVDTKEIIREEAVLHLRSLMEELTKKMKTKFEVFSEEAKTE